jgi:PKD repeat protein
VAKLFILMKKILFLFLLLSLNVKAQDTTKVLFIGNSITYYNDMPQTFQAIANSMGDTTEVTVYAPGGTGFIDHVNDVNVYNHFKTGNWDYVVLQPGSNESPGYSEPIATTLQRAKQLNDSILYYNPCAKIVYYEISYGVWGNSIADLIQYNETMDSINFNLTQLADSTQQCLAPAGEALKAAWNGNQNVMLWGGNGDIHPNAKGSYITACAFYATIFKKPSYGTQILGGLNAQVAHQYQTLADTIVLNNLPDWRIGTYDLVSDFSYTTNGVDIVNFFDNSLNADSVSWDFGDGTTSNLLNPIHTFYSIGGYDVMHTAYQNGCAKDTTHSLMVEMLSANEWAEELNFSIFPNPSNGKLSIQLPTLDEVYTMTILSTSGEIVFTENFSNQNYFEIDVSNQPKGLYYVNVTTKNSSVTQKFISKLALF